MKELKNHICRVCLSTTKKKYVSLFEKYKDYFLFDQINSFTNVQIKENDGFPNKICRLCLNELETAINFRQKCEGSNIILQNSVLKSCVVSIDFDVKDVVVKKEEPQEFPEVETLDIEPPNTFSEEDFLTEDNFDSVESFEIKEKKKIPLTKVDLGLRKSRAIDLKLQCDDCGGYFKSKCKLRVHWKKTHQTQNLLCTACKRQFKSLAAYNRHQQNKRQNCIAASNFRIEGVGKNRVFYCKECNYKSVRIKDLITHWVTHTGDRPFKCDLCPKTCTQLSSLTAHKEAAHMQYKVDMTCQYCGRYVKGRNKIYRHLKTHTDKTIPCTVCQKVLKNRHSLSQHMLRHSGHKSYTCEKCAHSFYTLAELANHKRMIHNKGKYWYQCHLCDYKSARNECVKKHLTRHTDTNVPCTVCGMFFESTQKLIIHQRRHFEEKKYSCPYCEQKFFRRDSITKHVRAKHTSALPTYQRSVGVTIKEESLDKRLNKYENGANTYVDIETEKRKPASPICVNGDV